MDGEEIMGEKEGKVSEGAGEIDYADDEKEEL